MLTTPTIRPAMSTRTRTKSSECGTTISTRLGRLTQVTSPEVGSLGEAVTQYRYDLAGNLRFIEDAHGTVTEYQYDAMNRVEQLLETPDGIESLVTHFTYDGSGNRTSVTDPNGNLTRYHYDDRGRPVEVILPGVMDEENVLVDEPTLIYAYDAASQLIQETDILGRISQYRYDDRGRLTVYSLPDADGTIYEWQNPFGALDVNRDGDNPLTGALLAGYDLTFDRRNFLTDIEFLLPATRRKPSPTAMTTAGS